MDTSTESLKAWARERLRWFGQSAFRLQAEGLTIFFDPWRVPGSAGPADLILVTHPHGDHYDRKAIAGLRKDSTVVVLPRSCAEEGHIGAAAGQAIRIGSAVVTGVAAYNLTKRFHPKSGNWLGYVVEVDGVRVYHAGDTDPVPEMKGLHPDIALIPIGGMFAMNWQEGARAVSLLGATLSIPMHYGMMLGGRKAGARFAGLIGDGGLVLPRKV
jgi:L-ascorbate metabolism protein UlaG (beta-lactamase superfamily)